MSSVTKVKPIIEVAHGLGLSEEQIIPYGRLKAKVALARQMGERLRQDRLADGDAVGRPVVVHADHRPPRANVESAAKSSATDRTTRAQALIILRQGAGVLRQGLDF